MELFFRQQFENDNFIFKIKTDGDKDNRKQTEMDIYEILKLFDKKYKKSSVSINNKNVVDETVRKSKMMENINIIMSDHKNYTKMENIKKKFNSLIKTILPPNFRIANYKLPFDLTTKWDMLVYEPGDFFVKHTDGKAKDRHLATLILIPPKKININLLNKKGLKIETKNKTDEKQGNLVIYDGSIKKNILPDQNEWLLVGFPINVEHECTQVPPGIRRVVFKTKFEIPKKIYSFYSDPHYEITTCLEYNNNDDLINELTEIDKELRKLKITKKEFKEKIILAKKKKIDLERSIATYQYDDLVKKIENSKARVIFIVLERKYETENPNCLIGEDRRLYLELDKNIPNKIIKLVNRNIEQNMKDEKPNKKSNKEEYSRYKFPKLLDEGEIDYDYNKTNDFETYFQNDDLESKNVPGELEYCHLSYNDQTYDTIYSFHITAIVIIKQ